MSRFANFQTTCRKSYLTIIDYTQTAQKQAEIPCMRLHNWIDILSQPISFLKR